MVGRRGCPLLKQYPDPDQPLHLGLRRPQVSADPQSHAIHQDDAMPVVIDCLDSLAPFCLQTSCKNKNMSRHRIRTPARASQQESPRIQLTIAPAHVRKQLQTTSTRHRSGTGKVTATNGGEQCRGGNSKRLLPPPTYVWSSFSLLGKEKMFAVSTLTTGDGGGVTGM